MAGSRPSPQVSPRHPSVFRHPSAKTKWGRETLARWSYSSVARHPCLPTVALRPPPDLIISTSQLQLLSGRGVARRGAAGLAAGSLVPPAACLDYSRKAKRGK